VFATMGVRGDRLRSARRPIWALSCRPSCKHNQSLSVRSLYASRVEATQSHIPLGLVLTVVGLGICRPRNCEKLSGDDHDL